MTIPRTLNPRVRAAFASVEPTRPDAPVMRIFVTSHLVKKLSDGYLAETVATNPRNPRLPDPVGADMKCQCRLMEHRVNRVEGAVKCRGRRGEPRRWATLRGWSVHRWFHGSPCEEASLSVEMTVSGETGVAEVFRMDGPRPGWATPAREPVALVTGASRGIGAATARRLAADGMAVVVNSFPSEPMIRLAKQVAEEIHEAGGRALVLPADVADPAQVEAMFDECEGEFGAVTTLVLNAATTVRHAWTEISVGEWNEILAVNLTAGFLCCRRAFRERGAPGSSVVVVSSVLAQTGAPNALHYGTTKAGLLGFTRSLARELGPSGVRVNCVLPGAIKTEEEQESFDEQDLDRTVLAHQILQRRGSPEDVANVVGFLAGADSAFLTGQAIRVDGGWTMV
ncbi:SDR family oxidoreductase [Amycolatopsis thermalba]